MRKPSWQQTGVEPDYRFSLANERTFLAWVRTGLALLAGGVLLDQFSSKLQPHAVVLGLAIGLCLLAATICGSAYVRWRANEIAMRHAGPLPSTRAIPLLAGSALGAGAVVAVLLLVR